ncbi:MAG: acyltransferase family protein, partial [Rhizobacter sp.]|nr:acyltransferase family protein [Rhizobacter sp.]
LWPVSDTQKSTALAILMFLIHIFRMSVFFLVAGLLAHMLFHRLGLAAFWRNRAARILAPLVLAWPVCFIAIGAVVLWALARSNGGQLPNPLPSGLKESGLNFLHLWFLYLLLWLYALVIALRNVWQAVDTRGVLAAGADRTLRALLASRAGVLMLAAPVAVALALIPDWNIWLGVPTPGYTLLPPAVPLFIYAYVFGLGWLLDRQRSLLDKLAQHWRVNFALGLVAVLVCLQAGSAGMQAIGARQSLLAAAYGLALMSWALAFVGAGMRYLSQPNATLRYLADASYWMYIAHLPLLLALQTAFMLLNWHWAIKYLLINVLCAALLLLSYRYAVRPTWVGLLLNGRRQPRGTGA